MFSKGPFLGIVSPILPVLGGVVFGVVGRELTVNESLNNIAGALARGVSGLTYGTSGCLEYGNTGNTVITPTKSTPVPKRPNRSYIRKKPFKGSD